MSNQRPVRQEAVRSRNATNSILAEGKRRTADQIAQDKQAAADAEEKAKLKAQSATAHQGKKIAAYEDRLRHEDNLMEQRAVRPDLYTTVANSKTATTRPTPKLKEKGLPAVKHVDKTPAISSRTPFTEEAGAFNQDDQEFASDVPEDEEGNTTSSSRANSLPADEIVSEESGSEFAGGNDEEEESESDGAADFIIPKKSKGGVARGMFRKDLIQGHRATTPSVGTILPSVGESRKKRKSAEDTVSTTSDKRTKQAEPPTGLLAGFKKSLDTERKKTISDRNARNIALENHAQEEPEPENDPLEYSGGIFDEDEPESTMLAARQAKLAEVSVRKTGGTTVQIFHPPQPPPVARSARGRKLKYNVSCLPFPTGSQNLAFHKLWRKKFKSSLIHWAANELDPFGTNSIMDTIVDGLWREIFPSLAGAMAGSQRDVIVQIAGDVLIDWRSSMGKEGIAVVRRYFRDAGVTQADAAEAAKHCLENYRFMYPDEGSSNSTDRGGFRGSLVIAVFAFHLKKTMNYIHLTNSDVKYGNPYGALGMSAAVVERALELFKSGHISLSKDDEAQQRNKKLAFADANWGDVTRFWAASSNRLSEAQWKDVLQDGVAIVSTMIGNMDDSDGDHGGDEVDSRMLIEL